MILVIIIIKSKIILIIIHFEVSFYFSVKCTCIGKPTLQNISPLFTIAKRGSLVTMAVVTNSQENKLIWIHDAQQIAEVPDDPDMAFYRMYIGLHETIYSLKIDNLEDKHYGVFTVKVSNSHKCKNSLEFILRKGGVSSIYNYLLYWNISSI